MLKINHRPHDYEPVLLKLKLQSLTDGRVSANKIFLRKLMNGVTDCPELLNCINFKFPSFQSRSLYPFYLLLCTTNYSYNQRMYRMMLITNTNPTLFALIEFCINYVFNCITSIIFHCCCN